MTCRWLGCSRDAVVRVPKESPKIGAFDLPLCQHHAKRATGGDHYRADSIGQGDEP